MEILFWSLGGYLLGSIPFGLVMARVLKGVDLRKIGSDLVSGTDPRGEPYYWIGAQRRDEHYRPGSDLEATGRGAVSVTPLTMDLTHAPTLKKMRARFK